MSRNSTGRIAEGLSRLRETTDTQPAAQLDPKTGRTKPRKDGPDPLPEGLVELARAGNFAERSAAAVRRLEIFAEKLDETLAGTREQTEQTLRSAGLRGAQLRSAVTKAVTDLVSRTSVPSTDWSWPARFDREYCSNL